MFFRLKPLYKRYLQYLNATCHSFPLHIQHNNPAQGHPLAASVVASTEHPLSNQVLSIRRYLLFKDSVGRGARVLGRRRN